MEKNEVDSVTIVIIIASNSLHFFSYFDLFFFFFFGFLFRALSKVYAFGPTFRAENSKSRLHLSEFYMLEAEVAFVRDIKEIMLEAELLVKSITRYLLDKGEEDMRSIGAPVPSWLESKFGVIDYNEAIAILEKHSERLTVPVRPEEGLSKEHELFLVKHNNGIPIFVINWPKELKPFYMKTCPSDSSKVIISSCQIYFIILVEIITFMNFNHFLHRNSKKKLRLCVKVAFFPKVFRTE